MQTVLTATQTEGDEFTVGGGRYQLVVKDWSSEVKLQIKAPESNPTEWIDTDQVFSANGVKAFWMSYEGLYRMVTGAAGASAYLQLVSIRATSNG